MFRAGRRIQPHRYAVLLFTGKDPGAQCVCHACDNPKCVNPEHLFLGSLSDNAADRNRKNRQAKGERIAQAKLTSEDVIQIRQRLKAGETQLALSKEFGVNKLAISMVKNHKTWRHV